MKGFDGFWRFAFTDDRVFGIGGNGYRGVKLFTIGGMRVWWLRRLEGLVV